MLEGLRPSSLTGEPHLLPLRGRTEISPHIVLGKKQVVFLGLGLPNGGDFRLLSRDLDLPDLNEMPPFKGILQRWI